MAKPHKTDKILRHQFSPAVASNSAAYSSPPILQSSVYASIRSESLRWVSLRLSAMFDRADDAFFEKAQKVFSNQEQETYFAAMREMRLIRILNTAEAKVSESEKVVPIMIRVGAWVSVSSDGENNFEPALRCKLAAHIKKSDRLIFVDRRGRKVLELCSFQLEQSIINKHLTVVEEGLVFERALENIVDSLRTTQAIELASQN